jgi:uncharacterized repeat protein (TIGR03803 family)
MHRLGLILVFGFSLGVTAWSQHFRIISEKNYPATWNYSAHPSSPTFCPDGTIWLTLPFAGAKGGGSVTSFTPTGPLKVLYSFPKMASESSAKAMGSYPETELLFSSPDRSLVSKTTGGGFWGNGVLFKIWSDGTYVKIFDQFFSGLNTVALEQGEPGEFYLNPFSKWSAFNGLSPLDPATIYFMTADPNVRSRIWLNTGTRLYRYTPLDGLKFIFDFGEAAGRICCAHNGHVYVPVYTASTLYEFSSDGILLHSYPLATIGVGSMPRLVEAPDGSIYGTTNYGGTYNDGVIFKLKEGLLTRIHDFSPANAYDDSRLALSPNGKVCGIASKQVTPSQEKLVFFTIDDTYVPAPVCGLDRTAVSWDNKTAAWLGTVLPLKNDDKNVTLQTVDTPANVAVTVTGTGTNTKFNLNTTDLDLAPFNLVYRVANPTGQTSEGSVLVDVPFEGEYQGSISAWVTVKMNKGNQFTCTVQFAGQIYTFKGTLQQDFFVGSILTLNPSQNALLELQAVRGTPRKFNVKFIAQGYTRTGLIDRIR